MKKIFIIDGNSLVNRAFYALPLLANSEGVYSNAVFGFVNCLVKLISENNPDYLVVAFDHARKTFRNEIFADYKGTRKETPTELRPQFAILKDMLLSMGIKCIEQEGIEADDIIGTITRKSGIENYIITGDRDSLQLINKTTKVWLTQKGITDIKEVNLDNIQELYSLSPEQIIEFKALAGDSSDNIPGILGIGEKTAINLLTEYKNVDNIYNNLDKLKGKQLEKIEQGKESCYMSKALATIKTDCDIDFNLDDCIYDFPFSLNVKEQFVKYNFKSLLNRNIFKQEEMATANQTEEILLNDKQFKDLMKTKFNTFSFNFDENFKFCINGNLYVVKKLEMGFADEHFFIEYIFSIIETILKDKNILKIVADLKANMHKFKTVQILNVFDISLANYLISGGNKPEIYDDCSRFVEIYKEQENRLNVDGMSNLYYNIELPLEYVLYNMEQEGFAMDKQALYSLKDSYKAEMESLEQQIKAYSLKPDFNPKSPKQIGQLLFEDLGLSDRYNKKHSTNIDALTSLYDLHPVVPLIIRHRKVTKLYTTYIEPYIQMVNNNDKSIIYTIFNQTLTSTGRLSSSEPNLQNIPVRDEEGKALRKMFISRFDGGKLISADYNQIELRLLANFSNDDKLISDYNKGTDIHRLTASQIFGIPPENVTDQERRMAKAVNFGIIYGISGYGLAKNIDMPVKDAKMYIELYFEKYPGVKAYLDGLINFAKEQGYAKTLHGRRRYIPELKSNNGLQRQLGERIAMNMPLQGSASDIIKIAMINVYNRFKKENIKSKLILQIHDELIVDVYPNEEQIVKDILTQEMQKAYIYKVPLIVGVGEGKTWYDCK